MCFDKIGVMCEEMDESDEEGGDELGAGFCYIIRLGSMNQIKGEPAARRLIAPTMYIEA